MKSSNDEFSVDEERQAELYKDIDEVHCRGIWTAVLVQACIDARSTCRKPESIKARAEALAWLSQFGEEDDLTLVCELAGLDPKKFRRNLKRCLHPKQGLDFRVARKRRPHKKSQKTCQTTTKGESHDISQQTNQDHSCREHQSRHLGESQRIRSHVSLCRALKELQGGRRVA